MKTVPMHFKLRSLGNSLQGRSGRAFFTLFMLMWMSLQASQQLIAQICGAGSFVPPALFGISNSNGSPMI